MPDNLLSWREEFPILEKCTYLINNSLGAMPRGVYDSLATYADTWSTLGVSSWGHALGDNPTWWELNGAVGDKIAPLMGAPAGTVLVHQNASIANSILFSGLDFSDTKRNKVVITDMDFPSDVYVLRRWLPDHMQIHTVRTHDGISIDTDELLDAIDENTRLVSVSHVLFKSAYIMPAKEIVAKAHRVGAQVVFNGYHSIGIIPVDVQEMNVDFYIGGTLKWMCGGPGGVFMYVRPDLLPSLEPKVTGWFAHKHPFAFDLENFDLREDAYRLMNGTPGIASLYAIQPGVDIMNQVGVENIRRKSVRQTTALIEMADAMGYEVVSPRESQFRAGTVTVAPPEAYAVSRELIARNIIIDYREGAGIRIAPHFYNSDEEIRMTLQTIATILEDGSWRQHAQNRDFVT
ncbi:aminotransferase class V-fold PLP-dependent enzyme [Phototrophicus methaneseepsis]|uniref:Aminotransferase class V-fold PLP-dependent enzyme n=1 Tax=Phototrophicus methaneseepsis TaxID=2710758 RepID=A0A7S8IGI1_9CHLR|nr:aminotransferase class V-fold PLP-dependent enzyme [Phototrophicus methaneseepsis]QPC84717.1 aminotransferase class V-fold PLP-dependent enzyme [Phototrophicus methaneseepsis]